jgi:hypothetical protein
LKCFFRQETIPNGALRNKLIDTRIAIPSPIPFSPENIDTKVLGDLPTPLENPTS